MKRKITIVIAAAALLAIAVIAAGCGSSAGSSPYSSAPYGSAVPASAPSGIDGAARVGVAKSPLGRIVVDSKGRTLYLFEKDKNRRSACYGLCATYWPPLLTHGKPVARTGVRQLLLGVTRRANGSEQVTYAGHPLYRFVEDRQAGQTKGEGLNDFGAGWDVLSPAGKEIESDG
jgi:predicted lipoprotein with Yx(FWY)xxD motif